MLLFAAMFLGILVLVLGFAISFAAGLIFKTIENRNWGMPKDLPFKEQLKYTLDQEDLGEMLLGGFTILLGFIGFLFGATVIGALLMMPFML